jgi:PEP-CTERM motif
VKTLLCLFFTAGVAISTATTSNFSFEGLFLTDDQVQLFDFTLTAPETVTFQTWGYGGGTNAHGTVIAPDGFESLLTWFGSDGTFINNSNSCGSGNLYLGACLDASGQMPLAAGTYTLALTQEGNVANCADFLPGDLSCGFSQQGNGNYTPAATGLPGCTAFCGTLFTQEDGHWAVDILNVASATEVSGATPEPSTWILSIAGIALLLVASRRRGNQAA